MNNRQKAELFLRRFSGRFDVYGKARYTTKEDGTPFKQYNPVCEMFWSPGCHIKLKDGISCARCEIKKYVPVTEDSVLKHIMGSEEHIIYTLREDDTIRFGALDFDCKPNKEAKGYTWEDVEKVLKVVKDWKIEYGVARSTTQGYHVYFFFNEPIEASKFRAVMLEIFDRVGFLAEQRAGVRPLVEIFPKAGSAHNIGNGIKPPMIEPQFAKERNCWVTDQNQMIPAQLQWEYLSKIKDNDPKTFEQLIKSLEIPVFETGSSGKKGYSSLILHSRERKGSWNPPLTGSYEKVLEGCFAMRKVRSKWLAGEEIGHNEGFGAYWLAMHTADGLDIFTKESGWGRTDADRRQLEQSLASNYNPPTCRKLQEMGVCIAGTQCFKKKPPYDQVEGQTVVRDDLPEDTWPEPSPIRYAFGKGDDFLKKLLDEASELVEEKDPAIQQMKLKQLISRVQVFDTTQQEVFRTHIQNLKVSSKRSINQMFREEDAKKTEEFKGTAKERRDSVVVGNIIYRKIQPHGYAMIRKIKGNQESVDLLCTTDIVVSEERVVRDEDQSVRTIYKGTASYAGYSYPFEIELGEWVDNTKFIEYFSRLLASGFNVLRSDIDHIRQAAIEFSRPEIKKTAFHATQGWHKGAYLMPSVIVDKEGIRPNTEQRVDLGDKEFANKLDFQILPDPEFKDLMFHIKNDFMQAWPPELVYIGISHALSSAILKPIGMKYQPSLFLEGGFNTGKSAMTHLLQYFYGDFKRVLGVGNASKASIMEHMHSFRDCLLVLDDFKALTPYQVSLVMEALQYGYDGTVSAKLRRDGQQRKSKGSRCLLALTGEMMPEHEASMVSRTIIVESRKRDKLQTKDKYRNALERCHQYNAIVPRFLHWFLQQDIASIKADWMDLNQILHDKIRSASAADRIAENLSLNAVVWKMWCHFLVFNEVSDPKESEKFIQKHMKVIEKIMETMVRRCEEEQHAVVFKNTLVQMLQAGELSIRYLEGFDREFKPCVGFVKQRDATPNRLYLYPERALEHVKSGSRNSPIPGTVLSIGRQLHDLGILCESEDGRYQKTIRDGDQKARCWVLDIEKLGLTHAPLRVVHQTEPLPLPYKDEDGLF